MYEVILEKSAKNFLKKLDKPIAKIIIGKLRSLKGNPRLGKPLAENLAGSWSLRIGKFRAIYMIKDKNLVVLILKIGHRKKGY
tara:strand:+ start:350 stop:598 length:249 start_codon:yes stop_codon:yes gene_type:complete